MYFQTCRAFKIFRDRFGFRPYLLFIFARFSCVSAMTYQQFYGIYSRNICGKSKRERDCAKSTKAFIIYFILYFHCQRAHFIRRICFVASFSTLWLSFICGRCSVHIESYRRRWKNIIFHSRSRHSTITSSVRMSVDIYFLHIPSFFFLSKRNVFDIYSIILLSFHVVFFLLFCLRR